MARRGHGNGADNLRINWVAIVLAIVSIIQGLALARLAETMDGLHQAAQWSAFTLAFFVVVRVFQTYVAAAVDYSDWTPNLLDLVLIFGVGLVQFQLISGLQDAPFHGDRTERWTCVIGALGLIGHASAYARIRVRPQQKWEAERRLQLINMAGSAVVALTAIPILAVMVSEAWLVALPLVQALAIAVNVHLSLASSMAHRN
ncbi:MAG: hypothetical protein QOJ29_2704 [Thermoleophilaceae bacterium]|jgi:hypothetical protein|nr:hypothetical protein [Thermoleophilaceae bacterium]